MKRKIMEKKLIKKIISILSIFIVFVIGICIIFNIYIAVSTKELISRYDYDKIKNEMNAYTEISYDEIPTTLINAVVSADQPDYFTTKSSINHYLKYLIKGKKEYNHFTIPILITKYNNNIVPLEKIKFYNYKISYVSSKTIEKDFTKEELLAYYLNTIYFGTTDHSIYGIEDASKSYFNKNINELSLSEYALLAGMAESPNRYNPIKFYKEAVKRRNEVLELMNKYGYINDEEKESAEREKIVIYKDTVETLFKKDTILLNEKNEKHNFDNLELEFNGINNNDEYYSYLLKVKYADKEINSDFFNNKNNIRIWSANRAAHFNIYKIQDVYILDSFIAKQCFGSEILIFNTGGKILKVYSNADIKIEGTYIQITTSDNGQCMGDNWHNHVTKYNYYVVGSNLF